RSARVGNRVAEILSRSDIAQEKLALFAPRSAAPPRQERSVLRRIKPIEGIGSIGGERADVDERSRRPASVANDERRLHGLSATLRPKITPRSVRALSCCRGRHVSRLEKLANAGANRLPGRTCAEKGFRPFILLARERDDFVGVAVLEPSIGIGDVHAENPLDEILLAR